MIFDCYVATALPGRIPDYNSTLEASLRQRPAGSPLAGAWRAEIGVLSQVVQLWSYPDLTARATALDDLAASDFKPAVVDGLLEDECLETWTQVPFVDPVEPGTYGEVYEMRTYAFRPGTMGRVLETWQKALPQRMTMSPLVACMYAESGELNRLRHIWAYQDLNERARIRREALALPSWPPMTREWRTHEESQVLVPELFSPLR